MNLIQSTQEVSSFFSKPVYIDFDNDNLNITTIMEAFQIFINLYTYFKDQALPPMQNWFQNRLENLLQEYNCSLTYKELFYILEYY